MVAYLEKSEGSEGFHQIIDFLSISHIKYALTEGPTIYASTIEQFWQTAALSTTEDEVKGIIATIDRKVKVFVSEASIGIHLKLEDSEGLKTLPTIEIFEQLALMGSLYLTIQEAEEDPSNQGRSLIEELDLDAGISLVPTHAADQGRIDDTQISDQPEEQRRREVSTCSGGVSTASRLVSTANISIASELDSIVGVKAKDKGKAIMHKSEIPKKFKTRVQVQISVDEELAKKVFEEEQARFNAEQEARFKAEQEQERIDFETALELQKQLDERKEVAAKVDQAHDTDWSDPAVLRYHAADQGRIDDTQISDQPEEQLGVFSAATALADAARRRQSVENVQTYTRRRREVSTGSGKAIMHESEPPKKIKKRVQVQMSVDEELAKKVFKEEQARFNAEQEARFKTEQEQERIDFETTLELQKQLDEREEVAAKVDQAQDTDWSDPAVLRYHTLQNRPFSMAKVRKNMCLHLKNQGGCKMSHFKGMSYEDIRPIFKRVWDQNQAFIHIGSEIEKEVMKRLGFNLQTKDIFPNYFDP
ncbi:hypothetical protein Tco_1373073, partial [Tanacetum coccineum]